MKIKDIQVFMKNIDTYLGRKVLDFPDDSKEIISRVIEVKEIFNSDIFHFSNTSLLQWDSSELGVLAALVIKIDAKITELEAFPNIKELETFPDMVEEGV